jgi:hypothetical protein
MIDRRIITISDEGAVTVPAGVRMTVCEIADTFGVFYQTVKRYIRDIEKSGVADGDYKMTCIVDGMNVYPEYYDLEMIIALAFRFRSWQADRFRQWIVKQATSTAITQIMLWKIPNTGRMPS